MPNRGNLRKSHIQMRHSISSPIDPKWKPEKNIHGNEHGSLIETE